MAKILVRTKNQFTQAKTKVSPNIVVYVERINPKTHKPSGRFRFYIISQYSHIVLFETDKKSEIDELKTGAFEVARVD